MIGGIFKRIFGKEGKPEQEMEGKPEQDLFEAERKLLQEIMGGKDQVEQLKKRVSELEKLKNGLVQENNKYSEIVKGIESRIRSYQEKIDSLEKELQSIESMYQEKLPSIQEELRAYLKNREKIGEYKSKIEELRKSTDEIKKKIGEYESKLKELEDFERNLPDVGNVAEYLKQREGKDEAETVVELARYPKEILEKSIKAYRAMGERPPIMLVAAYALQNFDRKTGRVPSNVEDFGYNREAIEQYILDISWKTNIRDARDKITGYLGG